MKVRKENPVLKICENRPKTEYEFGASRIKAGMHIAAFTHFSVPFSLPNCQKCVCTNILERNKT